MCNIYGTIGHSENNCPETQQDVNFIINNSGSQQQRQGWGQPQWTNYQSKYPSNYYNSFNPSQPSLRDLILEQAKINENISKKLASNDKVLENINTKMDSFSSSIKDQLSYNKKIESQIARLAAALPFSTNPKNGNAITTRGGKSTRDPPYPTRTGKTPAVQQEKKNDEVEEVEPQEQEMQHNFHDTNFLPFPHRNRKAKVDE